MHPLLENIFETGNYINSKKETIVVHSETSKAQCLFLQEIIKKNNFSKSIEIGLAYGTSTLAITEAIVNNGGKHIAIDKFQTEFWGGNGTDLLNQAGYAEKFNCVEDYSYKVLPTLLQKGEQFDFAYIDTTKLFDYLSVDFFYLDKLLMNNGIIVFDDVSFPGIRKLLRYISQLPHYKVYACIPENKKQKLSKMARFLNSTSATRKYLKEEIVTTDFKLGVNSHCVALQKLGADNRNYDWHISF